jgi:hypothetical protein
MQQRAGGTLNAVGDLLYVGLKKQIHAGDTLGVWTFSDKLYTGRFPLQHWSPQDSRAITERVMGFLTQQTNENQANFDKLLPALGRVLKASPYLTVILVTDGEDFINGTPFDNQINQTYKVWRERQQKAQMPFLTVLRAREGTITDFGVSPAPWPVEMPPLPPELQVARNAEPQAQPSTNASAPTVSALVFHGKDPKPSGIETLASAPGKTNSQAASALSAAQVAVGSPVDPSNAPVLMAQAEPPRYHVPGTAAAPAETRGPLTPPQAARGSNLAPRGSAASSLVQTAVAVPPTAPTHRKNLWLAAVALISALVGLGFLLGRRTRPVPHASLITRSLEREKK